MVSVIKKQLSFLTGWSMIIEIMEGVGEMICSVHTMGINGITNNLTGMPTTCGNNVGSASLGLSQSAQLFCVYHDTNVTPSSVTSAIGTPTMAVKSLSGLSGYCECRNASVSAPAESGILDKINGYLNEGFFIE